ncbi:MAG TPA: hypothetical protein DCM67_02700 [Propionibacteriaceae bacterium]|nr:hypothetical protein [Propionibacteriaceae bacterium]
MNTEITRYIDDVGISITLHAPEDWLEYPVEGAVLALSGDLGQPADSLRPSALWNVVAAPADAGAAFAQLRADLMVLPEAEIITEDRDDTEPAHYSVAVAFRNAQTDAVQISVVHALYVALPQPVVVQAVANCGGAADIEVIKGITAIVRSTVVQRLEQD